MKRLLLSFVFVLFLLPACRAQEVPQGQQAQSLPPIEVYFSPKGGCTGGVVRELAGLFGNPIQEHQLPLADSGPISGRHRRPLGQILDRRVEFADEVLDTFAQPVLAASPAPLGVHHCGFGCWVLLCHKP